jgi:murein DD-endopeptidase MepM/ murein hydrolase activator NlpD
MMDGRVVYRGVWGGGGNTIRILHEHGYQSLYMHIDVNGYRVEYQQDAYADQLIALSGNTGESTGPHLHFEIWRPGGTRGADAINPVEWWHRDDTRRGRYHPNPMFIRVDGEFVFNEFFDWDFPWEDIDPGGRQWNES